MVWPAGTNSLWIMPLLSKKAINSFLTLDFCRWLFFLSWGSLRTPCHRLPFSFRIELVARGLISRDDVFQKEWILVTHGNELSRSFHLFCFRSTVCLCGKNQEQIFRLPKSTLMMVCAAVSLLMPNSSAINLSVSRRFCASICRTFSIISGILLVYGRPERGMGGSPGDVSEEHVT